MKSCFRRARWFVAVFSVLVSFAVSGPAWPQVPQVDPGEWSPLRSDADGSSTLALHVDDGPGGSFTYSEIGTPYPAPIDQLPVRKSGVFLHDWSERGAPLQTVGFFTDVPGANAGDPDRRIRVPLFILENMTLDTARALDIVFRTANGAVTSVVSRK